MAHKILYLLVAGLLTVQAFHYKDHEYDKTPLGESVASASMKLLHESYKSAVDKNLIASPVGVLLLLAQYSAAAEENGTLRQEIQQYLGSEDYSKLSDNYSFLNHRIRSSSASILSLANRIYVSKDYKLEEKFMQLSKQHYDSDVASVDFKNPEAAAAIISQWAEEETKGHIKNAIKKESISDETAAALVNVIFFQGHWNVPFNQSDTEDRDFHVDKETTVKKPTMHLKEPLFFHDSAKLEAKMVELPYQDGFRMVVILPNEIDGLPSLLEKVEKTNLLDEVFELRPAGVQIDLYMPKFEIETELDLNAVLPKVGVSKIFTEPVHGLVNQGVKVDKALQKAFVKVNEEGATAGAFTGFLSVPKSYPSRKPEPITFRADYPFLFVIMKGDLVLFSGSYVH